MANKSYSAIEAVMGRLFERERSTGGGSLRRPGGASRGGKSAAGKGPSLSRMSRVGARHGQAIFKLVRTGGVDSKGGLKGQLNYIFRDDKVAEVIDPSGIVRPQDEPTNLQINRLVNNLSDNWWAKTRNGQTSHMILSFPNGTSIKDVTEIVRDVCNEKFDSGDVRYKYVAAIHDDQEHHPHAHIVLNRRGSDNSLFNMRRDTEYSYEGFRESMAAHAARRGIMLDPTSRFERGITDRQPTQTEQWNASREGRAPQQRPRTGADLAYAQEQINFAQIGYQAMAVIAANADCERLERAYEDVAQMLMSNEGDYKMPALSADELEKFDQYASVLNDALAKSQEVLLTKDATARVPYEKQLTENMTAFTALNPEAAYAKDLHEAPRGKSIYMHQADGNDFTWSKAAERIEEYTRDTGLDAQAISTRLQAGAGNLYLEQMWMQDDLRQVAKASELSLSDPEQRQQAIAELTNVYQEIREDLQRNYDIRPVPEFEPDYRDENGQITVTAAERASIEHQFSRTDFNYGYADDSETRSRGQESVEAAQTRAEVEGIAQRQREIVTEVEQGVRDEFNGPGNDYAKFGDLVINRDRAAQGGTNVSTNAELATAFTALTKERSEGAMSVEDQQRADALLRDTANRYGEQMRDGLVREDAREFQPHEHEDYEGYSAEVERFEQERLRDFDNEIRPYGVEAEREREAPEQAAAEVDRFAELKARSRGLESVEAAQARFTEFSQQSRDHAVFASELWDKSTDNIRPPEGYVSESERVAEINTRDLQEVAITEVEQKELEASFRRQVWDADYRYGDDSEAYEKANDAIIAFEPKVSEFAEKSPAHATYASELWDRYANDRTPFVGYLADDEREREAPEQAAAEVDRFAELKARSRDDILLTDSREEHQEVIRLLKENTTDAQYDRFRRGDLSAIEHITDDKVFSGQLLMQAEMNNRSTGFEMSDETERLMEKNSEALERTFEDHDRGHENER